MTIDNNQCHEKVVGISLLMDSGVDNSLAIVAITDGLSLMIIVATP